MEVRARLVLMSVTNCPYKIYRSVCQKQIQGFKGPQFKKFSTREDAEEFIQARQGSVVDKRKAEPNKSTSVENETKKADKSKNARKSFDK